MRAPVDAPPTPHGAYAYWRAKSQRRHAGVDLGGKRGTVVIAPEDVYVLATLEGGKLTSAPSVRGVGLGGYEPGAILARGASGMVHVLGHLEALRVGVGDDVPEGAAVGVIGPPRHVHWEVRKPDKAPWPRSTRMADTVDPLAWLLSGNRTPSSTPARATGEVMLLVLAAIVLAHGRSNRR